MSLINRINLEINLYGITRSEAIDKNICIRCKKVPKFYSKNGEAEYKISALCEYCFDLITDEEGINDKSI